MREQDLTIYEYRMGKEILYHEEVLRERMASDYEKISVRTKEAGYVDAYIYRPENYLPDERLPLVVDFHGGGMVLGYWQQDSPYARLLANRVSCAVIVVDYCLAPEFPFPKPVDSTYEVLQYIKSRAEELHINPEKIALLGHSAGGYLALTQCLLDRENGGQINFKGMVLNYALYQQQLNPKDRVVAEPDKAISTSRMKQYLHWYFPDLSVINTPLASPLQADLQGMPPTFILIAEYDSLAKEAEEYAKKATDAGCQVESTVYAGCSHGFTHRSFSEYNRMQSEKAWDDIVYFLKEKLR